MKKNKLNDVIGWYLMILIPILGTIIFNIYPLIQTLINSFENSQGNLVGTVNYEILFSDELFNKSLNNTFYMAVLGVGLSIPIAFTLANMINNIIKMQSVYKVIFLLPMIMSMVTVAILFKFIFYPDQSGIANYILGMFGIAPKGFFNVANMSRETMIVLALWKNLGYTIILFLAGLQGIEYQQYEAASIDGANEFHKWVYITIPNLKNTFTFVLITSTIGAFKRFTEVYAVAGLDGGPSGTLSTIMTYIYSKSFSTLNYKDLGVASAASIVLFGIILIITLINFLLTESNKVSLKSILKRLGGR